jgi:DNA-binding NtrC family response regulator
VLVIEDHVTTARLYAYLLKERGHQVEVVTDRFERLISAHWPWDDVDVAVVDLRLPDGIQGETIIGWLTARYPRVRTVAVTGYAELGSQAAVLLVKPVTAEEFIATVESLPAPGGSQASPPPAAGGDRRPGR